MRNRISIARKKLRNHFRLVFMGLFCFCWCLKLDLFRWMNESSPNPNNTWIYFHRTQSNSIFRDSYYFIVDNMNVISKANNNWCRFLPTKESCLISDFTWMTARGFLLLINLIIPAICTNVITRIITIQWSQCRQTSWRNFISGS